MRGLASGAMEALKHSLALAEPEGYIRLFVDEGKPMATLLQHAIARGIAPNYVTTLLSAFEMVPITSEEFADGVFSEMRNSVPLPFCILQLLNSGKANRHKQRIAHCRDIPC